MNDGTDYLLLDNYTIILIMFFIVIVLIEGVFNSSFIILSIPIIKAVQRVLISYSHFFKLISSLASPIVLFPIIILVFMFYNIRESYRLIKVYFYAKYIGNITKIIFASPRPFWIANELLLSNKCHSGYGNPSGHSFISTSFYLILCNILLQSKSIKHPQNNPAMTVIVILIKKSLPYITLLIIAMILFSRIVLGVHSIDQVLFGSLLGYVLYKILIYFDNDNDYSTMQMCIWLSTLVLFSYVIYCMFDRQVGGLLYIKMISKGVCGAAELPNDKAWIATLGVVGLLGGYCGLKDFSIGEIKLCDEDAGWRNVGMKVGLGLMFYLCFLGIEEGCEMLIKAKIIRVPLIAFVFSFGLFKGVGGIMIVLDKRIKNDDKDKINIRKDNCTNDTIDDTNDNDDEEEGLIVKS